MSAFARRVAAALSLACAWPLQEPRSEQDPALDNLVHAAGARLGAPDALGAVEELGGGGELLVFVAGAGFGARDYEAFLARLAQRRRVLAVTLPGFAGTPAPPMPPPGTSYGAQSWTHGAQLGLERLLHEHGPEPALLVAHWTSAAQVALGLARAHPELVRGLVLLSPVAKLVSLDPRLAPEPATLAERVARVDQAYAPHWFRTITLDTWLDNDFLPQDYARHPLRALQLWRRAAEAPLAVHVRWLCELMAQDATEGIEQLRVPTLLVQPGFDDALWTPPRGDYLRAFCQRSWEGVSTRNPLMRVERVEGARVFVMDERPEELDKLLWSFAEGLAD